jgi:hypothetical protein
MINVIRKEVFAVEELQICMKQVRVDVEVVIFLERLHAYRTALQGNDEVIYLYSFSLAEPLVNAVVVKCMNT